MTYVLFSAALLFDVGHVLENRMVLLSTKQGDFLSEWHPYMGPMPANSYYRIRRRGDKNTPSWPPLLCRRNTILLARQLMPEAGFDWIVKDPDALRIWLALLADDREVTGFPRLFFSRALESVASFKSPQDIFSLEEIEAFETEKNALGEEFLEWLRKKLEEGAITVNKEDSFIQVIEEGVLIDLATLLDQFAFENSVDKDQALTQLERLGVLRGGEMVKYRHPQSPATAVSAAAFSVFGFHPTTSHHAQTHGEPYKASIEGRPMLTDASFYPENRLMKEMGAAILPAVLANFHPIHNVQVETQSHESLSKTLNDLPTLQRTIMEQVALRGKT